MLRGGHGTWRTHIEERPITSLEMTSPVNAISQPPLTQSITFWLWAKSISAYGKCVARSKEWSQWKWMRKQETCIDKCVCVGFFEPTQHYSSSSHCGGTKAQQIGLALAEARNPNPHVSCLCHSPSRLQTPHSTRPCRGASCRSVWSKTRDEFNSSVSLRGCVWIFLLVCEYMCVWERYQMFSVISQ